MDVIAEQTYLVGGAVRDELLGDQPSERDWVVTGCTPETLGKLGFRAVGRDFPVFIHPQTGEEYALARTERKSGHGYQGFTFYTGPEVSLEEDLKRRDLTINAIARDPQGKLIDPYGGRADLEQRILRHVSPAFVEDPLRLLRVARFAARFHHRGFRLANETLALMRRIALSGELEYLTPERTWQECLKALRTQSPQVFFQVLRECGALKPVFPEIDCLFGVPQTETYHPEIDTGIHTLMSLQQVSLVTTDPVHRFATLVHDLGKGTTPRDQLPRHIGHEERGVAIIRSLTRRMGAGKPYERLGTLVSRWHLHCHRAKKLKPQTLLKLFDALDVWRRPETLEDFVTCCEADARGRTGREQSEYPSGDYLRKAFLEVAGIGPGDIETEDLTGAQIGKAIRDLRLQRLTAFREAHGDQRSPA